MADLGVSDLVLLNPGCSGNELHMRRYKNWGIRIEESLDWGSIVMSNISVDWTLAYSYSNFGRILLTTRE